jgi:PAS domain S-box-containing protein
MSPEHRSLILIVEDDPGISLLQRRRLERAGFRAETAATVEAALATLEAGGVSLVVLDYRLGETTGLDLHRRMKASGIDTPVILVSSAVEDAVVLEAMRAGIRDIVVKTPDYLEYLPEAVRGVLTQAVSAAESQTPDRSCVLVVEDDPGTALLERRALERAGCAVKVAGTPDAADDAIRLGDVSLVVLDLRLPGEISGLELYERWKGEGLSAPAILVTGFADQSVAIRALRSGIRDFVPKSDDFIDYLPSSVDRVISQVRVERKLAESELRLASIIGTTLDAVVMCDDRSRIVLFNRSAEEMFGCIAADALDREITLFVPGLWLDGGSPGTPRTRERRELDGRRVDGTLVPIEVSVSDIVIHGHRLFTVIARDITERRKAEAELRETDRRKDEFLGMLAHELRNPLAAVMNAGDLLYRTVGDAQAQRLIGVVRRQARALARMVDDLLDVSRVTLGKIQLACEPMMLSDAITRAAEAARDPAARAGLTLQLRSGDDSIWVNGDMTRLEQVITNLLTNAIKFTPSGGRITLETGKDNGQAVITVRDTGIGIPGPLLPRVFDLFAQGDTSLDRSRSGLGIGLALVRQIVSLHGGTVTAASRGPNRGSEFVVRLPALAEYAQPLEEGTAATEPARALRVLVVDDQRDVADSVAMLIETLGHKATAVYGGADALVASHADAPDAMFVDIGMPGMTGYELAARVRRDPRLRHVALVALTGYGRDEDRARVSEAGFDLHITKPVTDAELLEALTIVAHPGESIAPSARK